MIDMLAANMKLQVSRTYGTNWVARLCTHKYERMMARIKKSPTIPKIIRDFIFQTLTLLQ